MENVKKTALYEAHLAAGGKLIDFAGWLLPVQYEGIMEEHEAVRNRAGMFDVSHMGEILVTGNDAQKFIQYLVTNDVTKLNDKQIQYAMMCYEHGGVVDDLLVYKHHEKHFLLVVNASNIEKDFNWIKQKSTTYEVDVEECSDKYAEIALQGPLAQTILQKCTLDNLNQIPFFYFDTVTIDGVSCLVSRTGYTGEDGFEIYLPPSNAIQIWNLILGYGKPLGLLPAGLGCRDTLRFEATLPLYGNEIDHDISPLEAGYAFCVKLTKSSFIGKEALVIQKESGLKRKIVGFEMDKGIPRHGYEVLSGGEKIGHVTTGYFSPTLKKNIGLALVDVNYAQIGTPIDIAIRKKVYAATVCSKKFYNKQYKEHL